MAILTEKLAWSKSLISAFKECQRKYAFSKITRLTKPENENNQFLDEVTKLKKLKNRHLWTGSLIHQTVGNILKQLRQGDTIPPESAIIEEVRQKMREEYKASRDGTSPETQLFEHAYDLPVPKEAWAQHWVNVETSLRWFFQSNWYKKLKTLEPHNWKAIDEVLAFDIDGIQTYVKIDLGLEIKNRFVLVDWKGAKLREEDQANLQIAALYAHEVWEAPPENIDAFVVSLTKGDIKKIAITEDVLMETYTRVLEEVEMIQSAQPNGYENPMSIPATTHLGHCLRCNYQRLCHPSGVRTVEMGV